MALSNSQYNAIIRSYNQKQSRAQQILSERRQKVYAQNPNIKQLEDELSSVSIEQAKRRLNGESSSPQEQKRIRDNLIHQKNQLLHDMGYPSDYLTPPYDCPLCHDTGYIGNEKCDCFRRAIIRLCYSQSGLEAILEKENFKNFSFDYYPDDDGNPSSLKNATRAYHISQLFLKNFDISTENILFLGNTGVGKTFLSHCIAKELIDRSHSVIYYSAHEIFELLSDIAFHREDALADDGAHIFDSDLLIIDDLGTEVTNQFVSSSLFQIINERELRNKSTIISTNLAFGTLRELYSERTFSRISSNYHIVKLTGKDIRIQKKLSN